MLETLRLNWTLAGILLVALVLRLVASSWWQSRLPDTQRFGFPDSDGYWELAEDIAYGRPYEYQDSDQRIFRTPGYPAILGSLFWVLGPDASVRTKLIAARVLSGVLGTLSVLLVAGWARYVAGERAGLLAAAIAAVYPEAICLGVFLLSEAPFVPFMLLHLICWSRALDERSQRFRLTWSAIAGVASGVAILCRPSWLLFAPFSFAIAFVVLQQKKPQLAVAAVLLLAQVLVLAPWWVRNYEIAGRFVPTSLQVGASLYDGLSPTANGGSDMRFVEIFRSKQHEADAASVAQGQQPAGIFEDRLDTSMRDASIAWAKTHPADVWRLWQVKLLRMWSPFPNAGEFRSMKTSLILTAGYIPLLLLVLWGVLKSVRTGELFRSPWILATLLPAVYFTALHTIFVSSIRYRQPALVALIVLAAWAIVVTFPRSKSESAATG